MARAFNVYIKRQLRLDKLTVPEREMYRLGQAAAATIRQRVIRAVDSNDSPAPPIKSHFWKAVKQSRGLKPIRDLRGTGKMLWPPKKPGTFVNTAAGLRHYNRKTGREMRKGSKLRSVGHLLDDIKTRKVTATQAIIPQPSRQPSRIKFRAHFKMLLFSPADRRLIIKVANNMLSSLKRGLLTTRVSKGF